MEVDIWWRSWNRQGTPLGEGAVAPDIAHPAHHYRTFAFHEKLIFRQTKKNFKLQNVYRKIQAIFEDISNNEYRA
jgi:hypothetical protein